MKRLFFVLFLSLVGVVLYNCAENAAMQPDPITNPDLTVPDISVDDITSIINQKITLSTVIKNDGSGDSSSTTLYWYISDNSTIDTTDTQIGTESVSNLTTGHSSSQSITILAPSTIGTYYYGACVEAVSGEISTNNNCSVSIAVIVGDTPDLRVEDMNVNIPSDGQLILSATVRNSGSGSSAATTLRWYRSTDATISSNRDFLEGTDAVSILSAGGDAEESITISAPSSAGIYYYGACVMAVRGESFTTNNCSSGYRITVVASDLVVNAISVSDSTPNIGQSITLSTTISNRDLGSSALTTLRWYRSVDSNITSLDTEVGIDTVHSLLSGGRENRNITILAPSSPGTYYYGVCVDAVSGETSMSNNCSIGYKVVVSLDFNTLSAAGNNNPTDIWSDGTTIWVVDQVDAKIYAYNLSTKARITNLDFNTLSAAGNNSPTGIWSDSTTMWVVDEIDDMLYAYSLSTKARIPSLDFNTLDDAGNNGTTGIWSDGTTMWVADQVDDMLYAYNLSTKARITNLDFNTLSVAGNNNPRGLWSDGTTMWVADNLDAKIYAYNIATKARITNLDFNTLSVAGNNNPRGLWSDGTTIWVSDLDDDKLYAYNLASKQRNP